MVWFGLVWFGLDNDPVYKEEGKIYKDLQPTKVDMP